MKFVTLSVLVMAIMGQAAATGGRTGPATGNYRSSSINYGGGGTYSTSFGGGSSVNYGESGSFTSSGFRGSTSSRGFVGGSYGRFNENEEHPHPYNFDYQSDDEQGNTHYHREETDASGTVRGSYGYTDVQGLYRVVDYIADANGFRASIRTNEPGTDGKESPADVQMTVDKPPAGIQDRYTAFSGTGGIRGSVGATGAGVGGYREAERSYGGGFGYYGSIGPTFTTVSGGGATKTGGGAGVRTGKSGY